jgi:hypothetical protein
MREYKCEKCGKCFPTKQKLTRHSENKKPCVAETDKTKHQCKRCFVYLSSKQMLTSHMNRKNKCKIFVNIPVVKSNLERLMEFEAIKDQMAIDMKAEYIKEVIKLYKKINNVQICIKKKNIMTLKLNENLRQLKERKTIPEEMYSIIPDEKTGLESVENLVIYYDILKKRIIQMENKLGSMEDEQDATICGIASIIDDLSNDRGCLIKTKKQLLSIVDKHRFNILTCKS